jgi:hypothetical protein
MELYKSTMYVIHAEKVSKCVYNVIAIKMLTSC